MRGERCCSRGQGSAAVPARRMPAGRARQHGGTSNDADPDEDSLKLASSGDSTSCRTHATEPVSSSCSNHDADTSMEELRLSPERPLRHRRELQPAFDEPVSESEESPRRTKNAASRPFGRRCVASRTSCRRLLLVSLVSWLVVAGLRAVWFKHRRSIVLQRIRRAIRKIGTLPIPTTFAILLRGSRVDLLQQSLDHHARCPLVSRIHIEWAAGDDDIPETLFHHGYGKLSSEKDALKKGAVFLLDEGILFTCDDFERGFREWQRHPSQMVGLLPCRSCEYLLVSDAAAYVHRLLLDTRPKNVGGPCQRLALSAQLAAASSQPSHSVLTKPLRTTLSHSEEEDEHCTEELQRTYGFVAISSQEPRSS